MSTFHDVLFPLPLAFGASGGPQIPTEIITLANGREQRNATRNQSRRKYDAGVGVKSLEDIQTLVAFFEARRGQLYGFRFKDPMDHNSGDGLSALDQNILDQNILDQNILDQNILDQNIGIGDGATKDFQLVKIYQDISGGWQRTISKPIANTVSVAVNGVAMTAFTVDASTGIVSFTTPPVTGAILTAGYEFDVPVRFDTDHLNTSLEGFGAGGAVHVPLIEILPYA